MSDKRKQHELKLIVVLAVASLAFYLAAAGLTLLFSRNSEDEASLALNMESNVQTLEVTNQEEPYRLTKSKGEWYEPDKADVPLNQTMCGTMTGIFTDFEPDRVIEDGAAYFAQFGLDDPEVIVTATADGATRTYLVGDFNDTLQQYYVALEGSDDIYLVPKKQVERATMTLLNLIAVPTLSKMDSSSVEAYQVEGPDGAFRAYRFEEIYRFEAGTETYDGDAYGATNIFYALKNLACDHCVSYSADEEDMKGYGLDSPDLTVTLELTDGSLYVVKIAKAKDGAYLNAEDNSIVYQLTAEDYETLKEKLALSNFIEK